MKPGDETVVLVSCLVSSKAEPLKGPQSGETKDLVFAVGQVSS